MSAGSLLRGVGLRVRAVHRYLREVTGETAYERHCERLRRDRPGVPPPTRREFQRILARRQEAEPGSRCC
ncbi:YbdD/YjiX family protein [Streptomyces sp. NPDC020965]|uniref:YbdD/YjiX family protein n=1 Tax=Streptomyces sp. NPDC020965 TaxID=3365105 RepID=UPI0037992187